MLLDHTSDGGIDHQRANDEKDHREGHTQRRKLVEICFGIDISGIGLVVKHDPAAEFQHVANRLRVPQLFFAVTVLRIAVGKLFFRVGKLLFRVLKRRFALAQLLFAVLKLPQTVLIFGQSFRVFFFALFKLLQIAVIEG